MSSRGRSAAAPAAPNSRIFPIAIRGAFLEAASVDLRFVKLDASAAGSAQTLTFVNPIPSAMSILCVSLSSKHELTHRRSLMKQTLFSLAIVGVLLSAGTAFAQSRGEANYDEECRAKPASGTPAEQAAQRQRCIDDAKKAAKTDVPGMADQPGTTATKSGAAAERKAARDARRATGAQVAKQPKQDPKAPTSP